jgi:hypothetical protein
MIRAMPELRWYCRDKREQDYFEQWTNEQLTALYEERTWLGGPPTEEELWREDQLAEIYPRLMARQWLLADIRRAARAIRAFDKYLNRHRADNPNLTARAIRALKAKLIKAKLYKEKLIKYLDGHMGDHELRNFAIQMLARPHEVGRERGESRPGDHPYMVRIILPDAAQDVEDIQNIWKKNFNGKWKRGHRNEPTATGIAARRWNIDENILINYLKNRRRKSTS